MSRKQTDYLAELLGEDAPAPGSAQSEESAPLPSPALSPTPKRASAERRMTLLGRDSALARIASGEVRQITELLLDPARVRIWAGNARHQAGLNEANCRDLIDAILAEGGQRVPAIVRKVSGDPDHDYEVIAGTRRHWAISWLRANSWPDFQFLAQVHSIDDETAFRVADIENRARKDVSDYERALNYRQALASHYGGKQRRMAERLRVSEGWLSKIIKVAALPDWAVQAFAGHGDIQLKTCYPLAQTIEQLTKDGDQTALLAMKQAARRLAQQQSEARGATAEAPARPGLSAADVVRELLSAPKSAPQRDAVHVAASRYGRTALSVTSANRNGVTLRLHAGSGASREELAELILEALEALDGQGMGLKP